MTVAALAAELRLEADDLCFTFDLRVRRNPNADRTDVLADDLAVTDDEADSRNVLRADNEPAALKRWLTRDTRAARDCWMAASCARISSAKKLQLRVLCFGSTASSFGKDRRPQHRIALRLLERLSSG